MTLSELQEKIDLPQGEALEYFEQFADLVETEETIPYDIFYAVASAISSEYAQDLVENYFEDLSNAAPDSDDELISLIENVKQGLVLAAGNLEESDAKQSFADQLYNFREWLNREDGALVDGKKTSVLRAIADHRAQKIGSDEHVYEFPSCADYDLDSIGLYLGKYEKVDILADADNNGE